MELNKDSSLNVDSAEKTTLDKPPTESVPLQEKKDASPSPRTRTNSLIPKELMVNSNVEGGRECAALATVFGVPEYIDSRIFWERQQYLTEGLMSKKQFLRPTSPGRPLDIKNHKLKTVAGYDDQWREPSNSILSLKSTNEDESYMLKNHENQTRHLISTFVNSVLDPVATDNLLDTDLLNNGKLLSAPMPTPTISFALPRIPTVSEFNDLLAQESTIDINKNTRASHATLASGEDPNTYFSSCLTLLQQTASNADKVDTESSSSLLKERTLIGTPDVFDLIASDNDERFIIWGPDPIAVSSSMATASQPERPSSYANIYNKHHPTRPTLKGFSSNVTAISVSAEKDNRHDQQHLSRSSKTNSMRKSAQNLAKSLNRLGRSRSADTSFSSKTPEEQSQQSSVFLKKAINLMKNQDNGKLITKSIPRSNSIVDIPKVIEAASIYKLIEKLTTSLDYTFMTDFFLTYRDFVSSEDLCQLLILRFYWALQSDEENRKIVRIRIFVVIRHWLNNYFVHDFIGHKRLRVLLVSFLNELPKHPLVKHSSRDQRIVKMLKRVVRRLKKLYYHEFSNSNRKSRVKVIAPPPPTVEQMQIEDIVRAKLSYQNSIRHKASFRVSDTMKSNSIHHHGNMAIQDTRYAPILIVGSPNVKGGGSLIDSGVGTVESQFGKQSSSIQKKVQYISNSTITESQFENTVPLARIQSAEKQTEDIMNESVVPTDTADVQSVASSETADNSLMSDVTAGESFTGSGSEFDDVSRSDERENYEEVTETDELEVYWLKEQQETLEFFHPSNSPSTPNYSRTTHQDNVSSSAVTSTVDVLHSAEMYQLKSKNDDYNNKRASLSDGNIAAISVEELEKNSGKHIRRVPSKYWCKAGEEHHSYLTCKQLAESPLPDELLDELQNEKHPSGIPHGLAKKLSRKSIERRKSERKMNANSSSMDISSAATSVMTSTLSDSSLVEYNPTSNVPEMPSVALNMNQPTLTKSAKVILPKKLLKKASSRATMRKKRDVENTEVLYEKTEIRTSTDANSNAPPKGVSSSLNTPLFKMQDDEENTITKDQPSESVDRPSMQQVGTNQLLSLVAQRLRHNSIDDDENDNSNPCACIDCTGNNDSTSENANRLSMLLSNDDERRQSVELRRKRATSVEMDLQVEIDETNTCVADEEKEIGPSCDEMFTNNERERDGEGCVNLPSEHEGEASLQQVEASQRHDVPSDPKPTCSVVGDEAIHPPEVDINKAAMESYYSSPQCLSSIGRYGSNSRSFIMAYKTSQLASQFCLIERDVLIKVGWEELIHCKWTQMDANGNISNNNVSSSNILLFGNRADEGNFANYTLLTERKRTLEQGVEKVIQRFNFVCQWVASEIVRTENINERVRLIEKFIRLAQKCKLYSNYATLVQILLGLQSPAVARLEKTWSKVSTKCQKQLNKLTEFTSPIRNWKNIRDSMTEVAEEYGNSPAEVQVEMPGTTSNKRRFKQTARIKIPFGGCIPFLGIYLSDLVFNCENPRFLSPNLENQKIYMANSKVGLPACLDQPLVNFRKYRVIATVIKRVLTFQNLAMRYAFDEDPAILEKCRTLQVLDAATVRALSASLE